MTKLFAAGLLAGWILSTAQANIGDTFEISCQRFGQGQIRPIGGQLVAYWNIGKEVPYMIYESFTNGQCDAIMYFKSPGTAFDDFEIKKFLAANATQGQEWQERPSPIGRLFSTTDKKLGAASPLSMGPD